MIDSSYKSLPRVRGYKIRESSFYHVRIVDMVINIFNDENNFVNAINIFYTINNMSGTL